MKRFRFGLMTILTFFVFVYTLKENDLTSQILAGIAFLVFLTFSYLRWRNVRSV